MEIESPRKGQTPFRIGFKSNKGLAMSHSLPHLGSLPATRREFLRRSGIGLGTLALAGVMTDDTSSRLQAAANSNPMAPKPPHFAPKAKAVIHLFLNGGPSQVDTFDPKPALDQYHGKAIPMSLRTERDTGAAYRSPFKFQKYGNSGIEVSELFSHVGEMIDDVCVIRSMHADVPNHEPSLMLMNCGHAQVCPAGGRVMGDVRAGQ